MPHKRLILILVVVGGILLAGMALWFAFQWASLPKSLTQPMGSSAPPAPSVPSGADVSEGDEENEEGEDGEEDGEEDSGVKNFDRQDIQNEQEQQEQQETKGALLEIRHDDARHAQHLPEEKSRQSLPALELATLALRQGRKADALAHYQTALADYPQDARARAGLYALMAETGELAPESLESRLRLLIAEQPEAASPYFALGNLLSEKGRWQEAEVAYFEACRLEPGNPDYRFNLAVSLERLRQLKPAAASYRHALAAAAGNTPVAFDTETIKRRINVLETESGEATP